MRCAIVFGLAFAIGVLPAEVRAQKSRKKDENFVVANPTVGDLLPELTVYTPDGKEFKTANLRGHHTVLTFGCLT
jgi:cytochrome oxidase Cu insertion factor (SCO1/SenC/PrrC family)